MSHHRFARVLLATTCCLALTACGSGSTDAPEATATSATGTTDGNGPFAVPRALDLGAIKAPCRLLTRQQVRRLGLEPGKPYGKSAWLQKQCRWEGADFAVVLAPDTTRGVGLESAAYERTARRTPTHEVANYPAVRAAGESERTCTTIVGTSSTTTLHTTFSVDSSEVGSAERPGPCAMSDRITGMVLSRLPTA